MGWRYGNESQYRVFAPDCGFFAYFPEYHYSIVTYMPIVQTFSVVLNGWIISILLGGGESNKLLQQSQHVYVLGSAITNVLLSFGIFGYWLDQFVFPCLYKYFALCELKNILQFCGGYQIVLNVCLVCYDRYRLVTLGTKYDNKHEVKRAKWLLSATSFVSFLLFVVPEIVTPLITGVLMQVDSSSDNTRCKTTQAQIVLGGLVVHTMGLIMVVVPLAFLIPATIATTYKLFKRQKLATAAGITSQLADSHKLIRSSLILFGMLAALMLTWGPYAVALIMRELFGEKSVSWTVFFILVVILDTAPALDPFAYAMTLPKLRARASKTAVYRIVSRIIPKRVMAVFAFGGSSKITGTENNVEPQVVKVRRFGSDTNNIKSEARPFPVKKSQQRFDEMVFG